MHEEGPQAPVTKEDNWLRQGARLLVLQAPRPQGAAATPLTLAVLVALTLAGAVAVQRVMMDGEPMLLWRNLLRGWIDAALTAWLCWIVARSAAAAGRAAPGVATLLALLWSAHLLLLGIDGAAMLALRATLGPVDAWPESVYWTSWLLMMGWAGLVQIALLWRVAAGGLARAAVLLVTALTLFIGGWLAPTTYWWSEWTAEAGNDAQAYAGLPLTDEVVATQPQLLARALDGLQPPAPGRVNLYALTYAPYASEDVFMRESAVVAKTMRERFGADGRTVELVMNPATVTTLPWATPLNLRQAIARVAAVMDRDRDVVFLHLTSHGGADGQLATETSPLQTEPMTPELLKRWLDESGVRWRVVSVSACYSGSWVAPLADNDTLVMTAADAEHTSYGCGKRSELTFFGRAMYEEELRKTLSFTAAHAAARQVIDVREQAAGKSDGYSNPQISEGAGIASVLQRLQHELEDTR
ncbi:C13 family peptidase [Roseateles sp. DC23W]|uniref:C13 family peptidase n=1 Tax=Pelomonas dachongensis TaxID=3299029 RepID=A0ABW7EIB4_9BURK